VIFCPQEAPENFLALTEFDCQQVFLRRLTLPVPSHRPKFSEAAEGNVGWRGTVD
jgi:hypothetical protein